nr:DUF4372 domain-containing protein [Tardiphaga sp.]
MPGSSSEKRCTSGCRATRGRAYVTVVDFFGWLRKPISKVQLAATVSRHNGDAYDEAFKSWDLMATLVFAQLAVIDSLRALEAVWNAHAHHHCHLGVGKWRSQRSPMPVCAGRS